MALSPGTRIGPYEITGAVGAGGMGEVYRATDTNLKRQVAIKVLPEAVAADADRLARFQREAEVLAALNHPNIAAVYGLEKTPELTALVMELVEGDDLSVLIDRGSPEAESASSSLRDSASAARRGGGAPRRMSLDDALAIASQIAEALEAAHEQGIVHRDLKPANIKVRADGTVKVLDFGLAKAMDPAGASSADAMNSPTLTARATQMGVILGTAAYMAPEQARGKAVDRRADIWAFGVVLYEMLTGQRAFAGEDISITLAGVLKEDVKWDALPDDLPAPLHTLLRRCLEKDPKKRLRDIGEARLALEDPAALEPALAAAPVATAAAVPVAPFWKRALPWALAAVFAALSAAAWLATPAPAGPQTVGARFEHVLSAGANFTRSGRRVVALSPDGRQLAYTQDLQIYLRNLDQLEAKPIAGTQFNPSEPTFSPDGQWLAFWEGNSGPGAIRTIPVRGGTSTVITKAENPLGMSWSPGFIVYGQEDGIYRVPDVGGQLERLVTNDAATGQLVGQPQLVDDGRALIYTVADGRFARGRIMLRDVASGDESVLVSPGTAGRLLPTGHLVFFRDGAVFAAPVTLSGRSTGAAAAVIEGVMDGLISGAAQFAVADAGVVAFVAGSGGVTGTLTWFDRAGRAEPVGAPQREYNYPRISPDGRYIATGMLGGEGNLFVWDIVRQIDTRLTSEGRFDSYAVWTADGRTVFFARGAGIGNTARLIRRAADGTGALEALWPDTDVTPLSLSPDGKTLLYRSLGMHLFLRPLSGGEPRPVVLDPAASSLPNGAISPDGRWIAYESDESGGTEIFVRPFPDVEAGRWQVSSGGGQWPVWSRSGRELFYAAGGNTGRKMTVVAVPAAAPGAPFDFGPPQSLFDYPETSSTMIGTAYDVLPDGQRFVFNIIDVDTTNRAAITVITDWFEALRAKVPVK